MFIDAAFLPLLCWVGAGRPAAASAKLQRKISANEADQLGDLSTLADPSVVDQIKEKFASVPAK
ncbi:Propionyl CoA synthase [Rhodotorula toruloides ATCC 204091]|uniref:Propionyl CoA synthase n=1 Tax=Rhodotorula toruloides TaxID=5286 RepID=A0A2T0A893_RHOTO|nr:Propionyl CoA synthase [Rhodotorula toruloides ATCC 204091]PRQ74238.1 propionyl CoA synthase [Rhodotorula toruloides]